MDNRNTTDHKSDCSVIRGSSPTTDVNQAKNLNSISNSPFIEESNRRIEGSIKRITSNVNTMASWDSGKWKGPEISSLAANLYCARMSRSSLLPLRKSHGLGSVFKVPLECNLVGPSCDEVLPKLKRVCSMDWLIGPYARGSALDYQPLRLDPWGDCRLVESLSCMIQSNKRSGPPLCSHISKFPRDSASKKDISTEPLSESLQGLHRVSDSFEVGVALGSNRDSCKTTALAKAAKKKKRRLLGEILGWKKKCLRSKKVVKKKGRKLLQEPTTVSASQLDDSSISDGGIANRNNLILKEGRDTWNMMQQVGFRSLGNDEEILDKISNLEVRDWEVFRNN
ncbi:hypothetical protein L1049_015230 [Liquidambar formosana]|uniref:Uncharacterized protein n=1 Tax=Liquidambar formosana TaxID=63359 RepID=A0AAP0X6D5_LIQFO